MYSFSGLPRVLDNRKQNAVIFALRGEAMTIYNQNCFFSWNNSSSRLDEQPQTRCNPLTLNSTASHKGH
jgi:hypothetical protein